MYHICLFNGDGFLYRLFKNLSAGKNMILRILIYDLREMGPEIHLRHIQKCFRIFFQVGTI